jgi:hypothetical protein
VRIKEIYIYVFRHDETAEQQRKKIFAVAQGKNIN